jgi:hypothetical protein
MKKKILFVNLAVAQVLQRGLILGFFISLPKMIFNLIGL